METRLEICIDGVASARAAAAGGADRVELCANLPEGGTTPSAGMVAGVRRAFAGGLMVIIRPRGYDFLFSRDEIDVMLADIRTARTLGADGVVIGCLRQDGTIDEETVTRLVEAACPLDITFHRAFDMARDLPEAMETIIRLGVGRILTSGGRVDAPAGADVIGALVRQAAGRVSLMPGGGLTPANLGEVVRRTGAHEVHLSARGPVASAMRFRNPGCAMGTFSGADEYSWRQTDPASVRAARAALDSAPG